MARTLNGWTVLDGKRLVTWRAGKASCSTVGGNAGVLLRYAARQFDRRVEPVATCYGWRSVATNTAAGGVARSNHLSGTAIDVNGGRHPWEKRGGAYRSGFTAAQESTIRRICAETSGRIVWGGAWPVGQRDAMHLEVRGSAVSLAAAVWSLKRPVTATQRAVRTRPDALWGAATDRAVVEVLAAAQGRFPYGIRAAQAAVGTRIDGLWGPKSRRAWPRPARAVKRSKRWVTISSPRATSSGRWHF